MRHIELLSPAGNPEKLDFALRYGADAVYLAAKRFGMRAGADNFTADEIRAAVATAHAQGKKLYLTVNVMAHQGEYPALYELLNELKDACIDAFICADLGVMALIKRVIPHAELHASTQCSIVSADAAEAYARLGCRRVVLARELTLAEIAQMRREVSREVEFEAFIHGSMCIAYSGRCLLSQSMIGRDANRGACAQPCRWSYRRIEVIEEKRPGMPMPIEQDGEGSYVMSSKDLCMIEHIPELIEAGIDSFKIEGRMKSAYYAAVTANAYRMAIDAYLRDPAAYRFDPAWKRELESVSHREYATGFFYDLPMEESQITQTPGYLRDKAYLAHASKDSKDGRASFLLHNKVCEGDEVELVSPGAVGRPFTVRAMADGEGSPIPCAPHPLMPFSIEAPFPVKAGDILRSV